jgi:hypothetical protein
MAPDYLYLDDATGDYFLDEQPTFRSEDDIWAYDTADFSDHPILGDSGSAADAAMYWMDHTTPISEAELSAMLDGLEHYEGADRVNREMLIAFKVGDIDFTELPIDTQIELIEASGYEATSDEQEDDIGFQVYSEIVQTQPRAELIEAFQEIAATVDDYAIARVASLSARLHGGEDPDGLIEEAISDLGPEAALNAHIQLANYLKNEL